MVIILGHENLDLDALGSMVLARYLHPGARLVRVGGFDSRIQKVLDDYGDKLEILDEDEVEPQQVSSLVVCDTSSASRLGKFSLLVGKAPVTVYDHHTYGKNSIPAVAGSLRETGATVTVLVGLLRERGIGIGAEEATLAYAGLYEDTGGFSYPGTSADDLRAAAWLLENGANLLRVNDWLQTAQAGASPHELQRLLEGATVEEVSGYSVALLKISKADYSYSLAPLAGELLKISAADAAFVLLEQEGQTLIIARSKKRLDVGRILQGAYGGGGHAAAAFARAEAGVDEVAASLLAQIRNSSPAIRLFDVMTKPIVGLAPDTTAQEALAQMRRLGYGAMPVLDENEHVVGVVRRRDLERAVRYGMGTGAVKSLASTAKTLPRNAPLAAAKRALKEGAGKVVIVDQAGRAVGIFTRTDLYRLPQKPESDTPETIWRGLPQGVREVLEAIPEITPEGSVYLVGGSIRDALLGESSPDVDLVVEGLAPALLAKELTLRFGGSYSQHYAFATAHAALESGIEVDIATAREEEYREPGALPQVRESSLARDLARRDFSVNAMAMRLTPEPRLLIDPFGGLDDLPAKLLRPLHPLSFLEDPSRIIRGVRLQARLGFVFHEEAERQLREALSRPITAQSARRLGRELRLLLAEPNPLRALRIADRYQLLEKLYGLKVAAETWQALERLQSLRPAKRVEPESYGLLLLSSSQDAEALLQDYSLPRRWLQGLEVVRKPPQDIDKVRALGKPIIDAVAALHPQLAEPLSRPQQRLLGRDLLAMGMKPGPRVGEVLRRLRQARQSGEVSNYDEELTLARRLIDEYGTTNLP